MHTVPPGFASRACVLSRRRERQHVSLLPAPLCYSGGRQVVTHQHSEDRLHVPSWITYSKHRHKRKHCKFFCVFSSIKKLWFWSLSFLTLFSILISTHYLQLYSYFWDVWVGVKEELNKAMISPEKYWSQREETVWKWRSPVLCNNLVTSSRVGVCTVLGRMTGKRL